MKFRARNLANSSALAGAALIGTATFLVASTPLAEAAAGQGANDHFPISVEEMDARRAEVFASVDSNGDGLISTDEFAAAELPRPHRGGHKQMNHRSERGEGSEGQSAERAARRDAMDENLFHALDKNTDGVISREEFSTQAMREARTDSMKSHMFERADQDGDGYLSPDEFPPRRLAQLDANGDGEVTRDELPDRRGKASWHRNPS